LPSHRRWNVLMADIEGGMFGDKDYFKPLVDAIHNMNVGNDWFLLANDFADYLRAQEEVDACYKDQAEWLRRCVGVCFCSGVGKGVRVIDPEELPGCTCVKLAVCVLCQCVFGLWEQRKGGGKEPAPAVRSASVC
jgi:hypothetical protein